jgi:hypothetical protein
VAAFFTPRRHGREGSGGRHDGQEAVGDSQKGRKAPMESQVKAISYSVSYFLSYILY